MADPVPASIDRHLSPELRTILEERFWRPIVEGSTLEALRDDHALGAADGHPALFADHGIVHVRDIAAGVVELAATVEGVLLPARLPDRHEFVVGLAVLITYVHDIGMYDPTPAGRRLHALHGAHVPFSGAMDDVLDRFTAERGPVVRRIADVVAAAPGGPPADVVLRELISLAVAHSKSTVPPALLGDAGALRDLMRQVVLTDLDRHRAGGAVAALGAAPGENARWYADPAREPFAWLDSEREPHLALAEDAIDAVRLVRAADALRQRGTTLRTSAGHEIFIDAESGAAVLALRTEANDRLFLVRAQNPVNAGEANLRRAFVTPRGNLRFALHRGRFRSTGAAAAACQATASAVADVGADVLGAFASRRPSAGLGAPSRAATAIRIEIERPADAPAFADAVAARLAESDPALAARVAIVADLEEAAPAERDRYLRGRAVAADGAEAAQVLDALGDRGMKVAAIEPGSAFEDVRRVGLAAGEALVEAGTSPAFVYVALGPGLRAQPLGGYDAEDVPAWLPIGITGVVRRAERNSTVVAVAPVEVLMIPGELFAREWFHPYEEHELAALLEDLGGP